MSMVNIPNTYDLTQNKVLLDGNLCQVAAFNGNAGFEVSDEGVKLRLLYSDPILKKFHPNNLKIVMFQSVTTVITSMRVDSFKMLPFKVGDGVPIVEAMLYGMPHTDFMD